MAGRIEDYAIIGNTRTVALVDRSGSIDWWCVPRIDSGAVFAGLLGTEANGRWLIAPKGEVTAVSRRYEPETLVLETTFHTPTGAVAVIDFMPPGHDDSMIHRIVEGRDGSVEMRMELIARFDYGSITPWVRATGDGLLMVAGQDGLRLHSPVRLEGRNNTSVASFDVRAGDKPSFSLTYFASDVKEPLPINSVAALIHTRRWWKNWVSRCTYTGDRRDEVIRSLITLKALIDDRTGAVCAAATTSLPEALAGVRNWDYRYSWLRDATFTLQALLITGYDKEANGWVRWLRRAVAGSPGEFQIMYGIGGERRLTEFELDYLPGYEGSKPVRVGNQASTQFQLDVFGELMDSAVTSVRTSLVNDIGWGSEFLLAVVEHLESVWDQPDDGIWEVRGSRRQFTHSKVMAWVAFDRAIALARDFHILPIDQVPRWTEIRERIHDDVCEKGFDVGLNSFTQYYGSKLLDASLLMLAVVGFLPPDDPRIVGTVAAIQKDLVQDGFVRRYQTEADDVDGLPGSEGAFLMTTFWLADNLALMGRRDEAQAIFDRLSSLQNDVGLFSEEYDPATGRMLGNFPQAFSHVAFINTAANLSLAAQGPAVQRRRHGAAAARREPEPE